jgi:coenzyme PQQ precursor peptide PqqA
MPRSPRRGGRRRSLDPDAVGRHIRLWNRASARLFSWRSPVSGGRRMKLEWHKPEVKEEEVGLEVTSYASAELDRS